MSNKIPWEFQLYHLLCVLRQVIWSHWATDILYCGQLLKKINLKIKRLPCGLVVKNLPANAGDTGSIPGPGRLHMLQSNSARAPLLSLCSRPWSCNYCTHVLQLLKPTYPRAMLSDKRPPQWGALAPQLESSSHLPQIEKSPHGDKDPVQPKINK